MVTLYLHHPQQSWRWCVTDQDWTETGGAGQDWPVAERPPRPRPLVCWHRYQLQSELADLGRPVRDLLTS